MKKKSLPYLFAFAIFFLLISVAALFVKPVYDRMNVRISRSVNSFSNMLVEKTGLTIRYSSFSPSILSSFYINDIELYDSYGNLLLTAGKSKVSYSLKKLLSFDGRIDEIISNILVDGVEIEVSALTSVLKEVLSTEKKDNSAAIDLSVIKNYVPQSIVLKNIMVNYDEEKFSAYAFFKKLSMNYSARKTVFELTSEGNVGLNIAGSTDEISGNIISFTININLNASIIFGF